MACFDLLLLVEQARFVAGSLGGGGIGAQAHHGERCRQLALAVLGRRDSLAFALAGVFEHRVLGGQALLRFEEFGGLLLRVLERFERGDGFVLVGIGRGIAQRLGPVAREDGGVLFGAGLGGGR